MKLKNVIIPLTFLTSVCLSVYTYALTDLSLTLSTNNFILGLQTNLQNLGFYNRGVSALLFSILCILVVSIYLTLSSKEQTEWVNGRILVIVMVVPLIFSYTAFTSYDIFNYIFDSRIITQYHQNPYQYNALFFTGDPMLHFMRWTHRTYPYGPLWLVPGVFITFLSSKLLIQMFLFKLLATAALIYSGYLMNSRLKTWAVLIVFNPLLVFEVLVSAHNDVYILFFSTLAIVCLSRRKLSQTFLLLGGLIKFVNFFLIPSFLVFRKPSEKFYLFSISLTVIAILAASYRTEFQIWYVIWLLPFAYLLKKGHLVRNYIILLSIVLPFSFLPYIYTGSYDGAAYYLKYLLLLVSVPIAFIIKKRQPNLL